MAQIIYIEPTPNPLAMKFKIDQKFVIGGTRNYAKKEEAWDNPIAQSIFDIHGVDTLFFSEDVMTVNKTIGGIWDFIFYRSHQILAEFPKITPISVGKIGEVDKLLSQDFEKLSADEKLLFIDKIMDETIRPGLARDGGGLILVSLEDDVLSVRYQGACGSCPSSTSQTLSFISSMLQSRVNPRLQVVPVP